MHRAGKAGEALRLDMGWLKEAVPDVDTEGRAADLGDEVDVEEFLLDEYCGYCELVLIERFYVSSLVAE